LLKLHAELFLQINQGHPDPADHPASMIPLPAVERQQTTLKKQKVARNWISEFVSNNSFQI
jgi:hypothetical protein